ncbi:hypothetical protein ACWC98_10925 [Streptomyces goshikiensis]
MSSLYEETGRLYRAELARAGIGRVGIVHKWGRPDLIAPYSDLDLRLILDTAPTSWSGFDERLAAAHHASVEADPAYARVLEHPPGFVFTRAELDSALVQLAEVATWTLTHGEQETLQMWRKHAVDEPWTASDARFYRSLLEGRVGGRYRLTADAIDNVHHDIAGYRRHCVAWHYVAPCWFAAACLATRSRFPGKLDALTLWRPGATGPHAERFAAHAGPENADSGVALHELLRLARLAVDTALRHASGTPGGLPPADDTSVWRARAWTMTAGMLRAKPARWVYYLDPPAGVATGYLIAREAKELRSAVLVLEQLAQGGPAEERRSAAAMAALLPPAGAHTTPQVLRALLERWTAAGPAVEAFLTGPYQETGRSRT